MNDLRKRIEINVNNSKARNREADAFSITFHWFDPEAIMDVANGLAGSFIEENLKTREAQAVGTSDFLADQLTTTRQRLEEFEQKILEYRRQYMGELPEQLDANLRILDRLQTQLSEREKSLRDEKSRLDEVESQADSNRKILSENRATVSGEGNVMSLDQLKAQLAAMKSNYTDRHPDVIRLKTKIAELEASYKSGQLSTSPSARPPEETDPARRMVTNTIADLERQRLQIKDEIRNMEIDIAKIKGQIEEYQGRVEKTPKREQELLGLNRDYGNIKDAYDSLLNASWRPRFPSTWKKSKRASSFNVVDYAVLPQQAILTRHEKTVFDFGCGRPWSGCRSDLSLDFLNTSLKDPKDYESDLGLACWL